MDWKKVLPHVIAVVIFLVVAVVYCKPTLEGKVLQQMDVTQWKGMAQNSFEYQKKHGHFPLWSNGIFSGMPAFQITSVGSDPISIGYLNNVFTLNLPKPISFFFLACVCFYFLSQVLKVNPYVGIFGALSYAYATYNPIIVGVGHDTKMQAIAYLPAFIASLLIVYDKKYLWGAACTAIFTALLISANHLQITYYAFLLAIIMSIGFGISWIKEKDFKRLFTSAGIAIGAGILGILVNAVMLFTTYEYAKQTIRGGSQLGDDKGTVTKTGLSKDYALSYSMYPTEALVMLFPRMYGGSSNNLEVGEDKSKAIDALQQMQPQLGQQFQNYLQFYWGGIDGVGTSGPPYAGAIVCFLALIGFVLLDGKYKWWILAAGVLTIIMSWGKYFVGFNGILLKLLPMYDKFRAPSMILVIPTLLLCMMAVLTLQKILQTEDKAALFQQYKKSLLIVAGVFVLALVIYFSADYASDASDKLLLKQIGSIQDAQQKSMFEQPARVFVNGLKEDRKGLFMGDILRSFLFILVAAISILLFLKKKVTATIVIAVIGVFAFIDVITIDLKYFNAEHFQDDAEYENVFKPTSADEVIMKDTGYYRVLDVTQGIQGAFNSGALSAYFHKSIGGYHPAKLSIYQDLIEKQLYNFPECIPVLNMLNTKYIITPTKKDDPRPSVQQNPGALGAAWFVKGIEFKKGPAAIMNALTNFNPKDTAIIDEQFKASLALNQPADSTATIQLLNNDNDVVTYRSSSSTPSFAVFSEVYYNDGWVASIDGKVTPIIRTNYVLRGLSIPAGKHEILFEFKPSSFYNSNKAAIGASALIWLLLIGAIVNAYRKPKEIVE